MEDKKIFLIAAASAERIDKVKSLLASHVTDPTIYVADNGVTVMAKAKNVPPHLIICDMELPKASGLKVVDHILEMRETAHTACVLCGTPPVEERHLDEIVTGRVGYWTKVDDEREFVSVLMRGMNYSSHSEPADFHVRFLAQGDILLREGDAADFVYFVRKGQLKATKKTKEGEIELGRVEIGEFVGEMAYINGEPRSAQVSAVSECELIEVPLGHFEKVLFTRPAWSKALMMTLSKRVKRANEVKSKPKS